MDRSQKGPLAKSAKYNVRSTKILYFAFRTSKACPQLPDLLLRKNLSELPITRLLYSRNGAEPFQELFLRLRPDTRNPVQRRPNRPFCSSRLAERIREAVRFVPEAHEQEFRGGVPGERHGIRLARKKHILFPFGETDDGNAGTGLLRTSSAALTGPCRRRRR